MKRPLKRIIRWIVERLYRIQYVNPDKMPQAGPAILAANHVAALDSVIVHCRLSPWVFWIAKKEFFRNRLVRHLALWWGAFPVDRSRPDLAAARWIAAHLANGNIVGIFPQGTRVRRLQDIGRVRPRNGAVHFALRKGVPIYPVGILGEFRLFRPIRIVFGDPVHLAPAPDRPVTRQELDDMSRDLMRRIFSLIDVEYPEPMEGGAP